jgi:hypothetical protein
MPAKKEVRGRDGKAGESRDLKKNLVKEKNKRHQY